MHPEGRVCSECLRTGVGAFCQHCGTPLGSAIGDTIEAGTFDWQAWAKDLAPFLGGLSAQEQALLLRGS